MSRIGKQPIKIPQGVKIALSGSELKAEGPKGKLSHKIPQGVKVKVEKDVILVEQDASFPNTSALQGLTRTLISNLVHGVHTAFTRELEIVGVGYRAAVKGQVLNLTIGYSHPVDYELPQGVSAKVDANTKITITGADKCLLGMVAAKIRSFKKPEPYQGKGIRYANEHIIRKEGKAAGAK